MLQQIRFMAYAVIRIVHCLPWQIKNLQKVFLKISPTTRLQMSTDIQYVVEKIPIIMWTIINKKCQRRRLWHLNRWVVPYLPLLSKTFIGHIDFEFCCSVKNIKYICKYVNKGSDMVIFRIVNAPPVNNNEGITL